MNKKLTISSTQLLMMAVGSALMFPYTFMPIVNTAPANQDVWVVLVFALFYILILNTPILMLINKFRGQNVSQINELILGKFFGKAASLVFTIFFLLCFSTCMTVSGIFISLYVFPTAPTWAFLAYTLVPVSYAAFKGPAIIGRLSILIVPFVMMTIVVFFMMGMDLMDLMVLKPVLVDSAFLELNQGGLINAARYSEILIFFVFSFFLSKQASINKTYLKSLAVFFVFYALILFPSLLVLGIDLAKNAFNPYFMYTRQTYGYRFIEKIQALNTLAWYPGILLKLTINNFMASYLLSGVFGTKSHRGFVIPVSLLGFTICLLPVINKSDTILRLISDQVFPWLVLPASFAVPLILVVVYLIRRKKINYLLAQANGQSGSNQPDQTDQPDQSGKPSGSQ